MAKSKSVNKSQTNCDALKEAIVSTLDALSNVRDEWQQNEYKSATDSLYLILAKTYAAYEEFFINVSDEERKQLRNEIASKLKSSGVKVQINSTTLSLLIRYVFKSDRKRVLRYRYVLEAAKSHKIVSNELVQWLHNSGGIDAVFRSQSMSEKTAEKRQQMTSAVADIENLIATRTESPLARVTIDNQAAVKRSILICEPSVSGEFKVVCVVEDLSDALFKNLVRCAAASAIEHKREIVQLASEAKKFVSSESANAALLKKAA